MGISGGPDMIQDGLVLSLDASDRNSYVSGSTTWFDLSGNNYSGSLVNGPTFSSVNGGILTFNGTSQYITGSNSANFAFGTSNFTIDYWMYINALSGSFLTPTFVDLRNLGGAGPGYSDYVSGSKWFIYSNNVNAYTSTTTIVTGSWYNVVASRIGTNLSVYFNGVLDSNTTFSTNITDNGFRLARNVNTVNTSYLSGSLANVRVYNGTGLTSTQVLQNYNALKSRFNL